MTNDKFSVLFGTSPKKRGLARETLELRESILFILDDLDPPVTVRQIFYQLSTRNAVEKTEAGYRKAQRQLLLMRREGLIHYDVIADNTRWMRKPRTYDGIRGCLEHTAKFYRQSVWRDLDAYVEVWCEKDALSGVLFSETAVYDVPLMVTRGYSSETFAFQAAEQIREEIWRGKAAHIYYLGDLDPSGWQMSLELESRLNEFVDCPDQFSFKRIAVTAGQVGLWNLPTRPSKKSDTRCKAFEQEYGRGAPSVELDAIPPAQLRQLVRDAIEDHLPDGWLHRVEIEEQAARKTLEIVMAGIG